MKSVEPKTLKQFKKEIKIINAMSYMKNALFTNSKTICSIIFLLPILELSLRLINTPFFGRGLRPPLGGQNIASLKILQVIDYQLLNIIYSIKHIKILHEKTKKEVKKC
ncbi:MAG: hypothetical protein ACO2O6_00935 [Candidatus Hydrothermia bacterium]|jgi:hypothetical protein